MVAATMLNKQKYHSINEVGMSMAYAAVLEKQKHQGKLLYISDNE